MPINKVEDLEYNFMQNYCIMRMRYKIIRLRVVKCKKIIQVLAIKTKHLEILLSYLNNQLQKVHITI